MTLDHERKHATRSCPMILCVLAALSSVVSGACVGPVGSAVEVSDASPEALTKTAPKSATKSATKTTLTSSQAKTVLRLVDTICGDTWCDGDYDFGFRKISCDKRATTCTLTLQIFPREGVPTTQKAYWRSCKTHGFTGFFSLVTTAPNGYQALQGDYYSALTECMFELEAKLPRPAAGA